MGPTLALTAALSVGYCQQCGCGKCEPELAVAAVGLGVGVLLGDELFFADFVPPPDALYDVWADPDEPIATDEEFVFETATALWRGPCVCGVMVVAMAGVEANIFHGPPTCALWDESDAMGFMETLRRYKAMEMGYAPGNSTLH